MSGTFIASYVILWMLVLVLIVLVLLLYRQYGLSLMDNRSRMNMEGLDLGTPAPALQVTDLDGTERTLRLADYDLGSEAVIVFAADQCAVCAELALTAQDASDSRPDLDWLWIIDIVGSGTEPEVVIHGPPGWDTYIASAEPSGDTRDGQPVTAHTRMSVPGTPFAYGITGGRIAAKALVNSTEDLDALVISMRDWASARQGRTCWCASWSTVAPWRWRRSWAGASSSASSHSECSTAWRSLPPASSVRRRRSPDRRTRWRVPAPPAPAAPATPDPACHAARPGVARRRPSPPATAPTGSPARRTAPPRDVAAGGRQPGPAPPAGRARDPSSPSAGASTGG